MILRTGKECNKTDCKNYKYYSNWYCNLGRSELEECINCKYAYVSQYAKEALDEQDR